MTYHLRRLRLHGLIERMPKSHRYRVTDQGWRTILFCTRCYNRLLRPGLAEIIPEEAAPATTLRRRFDQLDEAIDEWLKQQKVPA
jgi:DNA-binding MarR family transcriptional regulator